MATKTAQITYATDQRARGIGHVVDPSSETDHWVSMSEWLYSSGACVFDTAAEAQATADRHESFMLKHHSAATPNRRPWEASFFAEIRR